MVNHLKRQMKLLTAQVLKVIAIELNTDNQYDFEVLEFENGLIAVEGENTNDWYFENRDDIEPCGNAIVKSVQESGQKHYLSVENFLEPIEGSIEAFGTDSVPKKYLELLK